MIAQTSRTAATITIALGLVTWACNEEEAPLAPPPAPIAAPPQATTPDRLPPGELMEGTEEAFGLPLPKKMRIDAAFRDSVHAIGSVDPGVLSNYVRQRVLVSHVEMADKRFVFPAVRIRGGDKDKIYRIEVQDRGHQSKLVVRDITPAPKVEGLTEAERWERAGMTPNGRLIDPNTLE